MKADLHVHSTASDGTLSPTVLVELAATARIEVLAIADHDSVDGQAEARAAAERLGIALVPAVELSSVTPEGYDAHILGYFVDIHDADLLRGLSDLRDARLRRADAMVRALQAAGYDIDLECVLRHSGGGAVGRSHVARALVHAGHADSIADAFKRLIGHGQPYYVAKDVRTPAEAVDMIRAAGGLAVIAHPGINRADDIIALLTDSGLAGIEAYHADHTPEQRMRYAAMAERLGLLVTGGTDFHGPDAPNPALGDIDIPSEAVTALLDAGRQL